MPRTAAQLAYAALLLAAVCVLVTWRSSNDLLDGSITLIEQDKYDSEITPKKIYKDASGIDLDHPNRIDNYDCFFNDCSGDNGDSLVGTGSIVVLLLFYTVDGLNTKESELAVARLKKLLGKLSTRQKEFMKTLSEPVLTTIEVQAGPPGPLASHRKGKKMDWKSRSILDRLDGIARFERAHR